jgi:hypothetical protein
MHKPAVSRSACVFAAGTLMAVSRVLKRLILWDYQRGVWQYDVICGAIVLFIFLSPREWFRDQPRIPNAAEITSLPAHQGESAFWIEPELVTAIPDDKRLVEIGKILTARTRRKLVVTRVDPIYDSEQEVICYMAYAKP